MKLIYEAAIERITAFGGEILGETVEIPGIGKYVYFEDKEGNHISILQPAMW